MVINRVTKIEPKGGTYIKIGEGEEMFAVSHIVAYIRRNISGVISGDLEVVLNEREAELFKELCYSIQGRITLSVSDTIGERHE